MKIWYTSNNGWRIQEQEDMFSSDISWFSVYRFYPTEGWIPFKLVGHSLDECFIWLWRMSFISKDEMLHQLSKLA